MRGAPSGGGTGDFCSLGSLSPLFCPPDGALPRRAAGDLYINQWKMDGNTNEYMDGNK